MIKCNLWLRRSNSLSPVRGGKYGLVHNQLFLTNSEAAPVYHAPPFELRTAYMQYAGGQVGTALRLLLAALHFFTEDDGFRHFLHGPAPLPALPLQGEISVLLAHAHLTLQNSFRALDTFAAFQLLGKLRDLAVQPGRFDLRAHQKAD